MLKNLYVRNEELFPEEGRADTTHPHTFRGTADNQEHKTEWYRIAQ